MSKTTLNLSIEEAIKKRAKRIASQRGMSVSRFFEELIADQKDEDDFTPTPGSAAHTLANLIPDSEKKDGYNYKKRKAEILEQRYGNK